jgi:hypothetical protein
MSPRTIFLSRLIGLFAILISLSMLMHKQLSIETATTLIHTRPLLSIVGMVVLVSGLAMVLSHDIWSGGLLPPAQDIPAHRIEVSIGTEKPHHSLGLLERLDKAVEQNPVKTPIAEADAILVMFVERIHGRLP